MTDSSGTSKPRATSKHLERADANFDEQRRDLAAEQRTQSKATLRTVVDMVRRIMRADTASVASFSLADKIIRWKATSGFKATADLDEGEIITPLQGEFAERAALVTGAKIIEVKSVAGELPVSEFPLHSAEGVRDMALVQLSARDEVLGVLVVGYRTAHRFTADEKQLLENLAEMAALALDNARLLETVSTGKKLWEQTFDAIPDGIIVHDEKMLIARCNREAAEMMGFERPSEAIGVSCAEAFARLFGERAAAYHMKQGTGAATSFELQAEDGRRYLVAVAPLTSLKSGVSESEVLSRKTSGSDLDSSDSKSSDSETTDSRLQTSWSVITWSDITELSEIQEQLARSRRLATVGQIAAGVAHEINNPLAAITTCAEATLRSMRGIPEVAPFAEERNWNFYLEEIVRQALRCKSITRGLLDLSRQRRARRQASDINTLVERTVKSFEPRGRERSISFTLNLDSQIDTVATDEAMVRQILDNFLNNALDASANGDEITVSTVLHGERIALEVADRGPGIPPETLARIFDPFFTTKEAGKGSGLGLAISNNLAEAIGGALTVESKPDAGSRFRLWLPRRTPDRKDEG